MENSSKRKFFFLTTLLAICFFAEAVFSEYPYRVESFTPEETQGSIIQKENIKTEWGKSNLNIPNPFVSPPKKDQTSLTYDVHSTPLSEDYIPPDLVRFSEYGIKSTSESGEEERHGRKIMMDDLKILIDLCEAETENSIYIRSGFRSYKMQKGTYGKYGAKLSAYPGKSEHQLGLAVDIEARASKTKQFMSKNNKVFKCFVKNAHLYGFIQSYPKNNAYKYSEEPWHWRYVGKDIAQMIAEHDKLGKAWEILSPETKK